MFRVNKYIAVLRTESLKNLEHRLNQLFWFFTGLIPAFVGYVSWTAVYGDASEIHGFKKEYLLSYYLGFTIIFYFIGGTIASILGREIRDGKFVVYLTKPIHPILYYTSKEQAWKLVSLSVIMPLVILLYFVLHLHFPLNSYRQVCLMILSIVFGGIIFALWDAILGMSAFWLHSVESILRLNRIASYLLAGGLVPLAMFPSWAQHLNNLLFYRYTFSFALEIIFQYKETNLVALFIGQVVWLILLLSIFQLMYKKGLKIYEAYGS